MSKIMAIIDMQNDFVDGALGTKEAQEIVPNVVEEIRQKAKEGYKFFLTVDSHEPDYMDTLEGQKLPVEHCITGTEGWELVSPVKELFKEELNGVLVPKPTFGSLILPGLLMCEDEPIEEIEIVGLCTDICVVTNALVLRTFFPDVPIRVKADCCAGVTPEKHEAALETMKSCQIDII